MTSASFAVRTRLIVAASALALGLAGPPIASAAAAPAPACVLGVCPAALLAPVTGVLAPEPAAPDATSLEEVGLFVAPVLPADPAAGILFGEGSNAIHVHLPSAAASGPAQRVGLGQVVYHGAGVDSMVHADGEGLTIATVAPAAGASEQRFAYRFELPDGAVFAQQHDGSVTIENDDGAVLATIEAPWAKDGSGRSLPTSYAIDGATMTQIIDTTGAVGDVVADPHLVPHGPHVSLFPPSIEPPYVTLWLSRRETETVYKNYRNAGGVSAAVSSVCTGIGLISNVTPQTKIVVAVVCQAINAFIQDFVINLNQAHDRKKCLTVDVKPPGFNPLNPALSALNLIANLATGKLPFLDFNDRGGKECRP